MQRNFQIANILRGHPQKILQLTQDHLQTVEWLRDSQLLPTTFSCCDAECWINADNSGLMEKNLDVEATEEDFQLEVALYGDIFEESLSWSLLDWSFIILLNKFLEKEQPGC